MDSAAIAALIQQAVASHFQKTGRPIFLSELGAIVAAQFPGYRAQLYPQTLRQFIQDELSADVEIKVHPNVPQKIVVLPRGATFSFDELDKSSKGPVAPSPRRRIDSAVWQALTTPLDQGKKRFFKIDAGGKFSFRDAPGDSTPEDDEREFPSELIAPPASGRLPPVNLVFENFFKFCQTFKIDPDQLSQQIHVQKATDLRIDYFSVRALAVVLRKLDTEQLRCISLDGKMLLQIIEKQ